MKNEVLYPFSLKTETSDWIFWFEYGDEVKGTLKEGTLAKIDGKASIDWRPLANAFVKIKLLLDKESRKGV